MIDLTKEENQKIKISIAMGIIFTILGSILTYYAIVRNQYGLLFFSARLILGGMSLLIVILMNVEHEETK